MLGWWNGIHEGLKILWSQGYVGSTPTPSTRIKLSVIIFLTTGYCLTKGKNYIQFKQLLNPRKGGEKDETRNHRDPCEVGTRANYNF